MVDRARTALSGVVVSMLLMGPALALPARAHDSAGTPGAAPAEQRKAALTRQARHPVVRALRHRRPHVALLAAEHAKALASHKIMFLSEGTTADWHQTGLASWYGGPHWSGKRTSSGSMYDEDALTAAHASLPLGTRVRVTLVGSGRHVIVTINDRPGTRRRIIDLSREAARELGILDRGIAMVTLTPAPQVRR